MVSMFLYGIAIMYSPGPINLLGLNQGVNRKAKSSLPFYIGVGLAMFIWFNLFGYTGERIIKKEYILYISIVGGIYILYLAFKVWGSSKISESDNDQSNLKFHNGLFMQLLNPKAVIATLPIATIHYVTNGINGINILVMSLILSVLAFGAPFTYSMVGYYFGSFLKNQKVLSIFNKIMSLMLAYVAVDILISHVVLVLLGINDY